MDQLIAKYDDLATLAKSLGGYDQPPDIREALAEHILSRLATYVCTD
ncbi:MAG TPA: hypothetical protein VJ787_05040 [Thermoleophilia bacterium]|nr:hypothetical protein [Thermoleophilia bacterium]